MNTFQNTMIEGYLASVKKKVDIASIVGKKKYFVFIIHRQEHVVFGKDQSKKIIETVLKYSDKKLLCIFITHATTVNFLKSVNFKLTPEQEKRVKFVSRLHYIDFVNLIDNSEFLVTDGGSNQEEAYYMGLPCLLLRNKTERIEGLGENVVLSKNNPLVIKKFMQNYKSYRRSKIDLKIKPSKIIVDYLLK